MSPSDFIKNILNIQDNNISFPEENYFQIVKKKDFFIKVFKGFLKSNHCDCPHCKSKNIVKNGSRIRKVKYIPYQNYNIELELTVQRYICKDCKKTFSPSTNVISNNSSISNNLKYTIALELQKNISLTSIAKRYSISVSSVQRIMDTCYSNFKVNREHLPETICIDEFKSIFPNGEIVLDKFHIINLISRAFNQTRIFIMNSIQDDSLKRKLKRFWKLLLKYYPDLCEIKYYCQSFKYKLNSKDKVDYLLDKIPELEINFNIYQDIIQAIKHNNFKRFEGIVEKYLGSKEKNSEKMRVALKTLKKYMKYIKNMFETNITNGVIEGLNNKIKSIKRTAFGYSKFNNFKKRILIQEGIISINA